jgi:NAD(P)-dependent dehydrogenase (short-subunit alcohol dehydrogenase family)
MQTLAQAKALITGGTSGLGLATAQRITRAGGQVVILAQNEQHAGPALQQLGETALFIQTDVRSEASVDSAMQQSLDYLGHINLAVNCAGVAPSVRVLGREGLMETGAFSDAVAINLIGSFCVCRAAANAMQSNPADENGERGVIINTASIAAYDGQIGQAAYAASKGGIVSMTLPLAREFARIGIRVMSIAPGLFQTPMVDGLPAKAIRALTESIPFPKRLGEPEEFAFTVEHIFLNVMLNGTTIRLDGALRM